MKKEELKNKFEELKVNASSKVNEAAQWVSDNPEITLCASALIGKFLWEFGRAAKRKQDAETTKERRSRIYDPSLGCSWQLKRELSNREMAELKNRIDLGESRYDVLTDMKVLKK